MSRLLRWIGYAVGTLAAIVVVAVAVVWVVSERRISSRRVVPVEHIAVSRDSATLARGNHLVAILGCSGCHGKQLQGKVMFDDFRVARLVAPNLTERITKYSDDSLAHVIRDGVNSEGRGVLAMPSSAFYNLSNADIGAIIAALRTRPSVVSDPPLPPNAYRLLGRVGIATGRFKPEPEFIDRTTPRLGERGDTTPTGRGEYLAKTSCIECHGPDLRGGDGTPSLAGAYGYSLDEFVRLARTGTPREARPLTMMAGIASDRLAHMSENELADLHAYLRAIPPQSSPAAPR
jgi:mono/diheme cytochrome c family protein